MPNDYVVVRVFFPDDDWEPDPDKQVGTADSLDEARAIAERSAIEEYFDGYLVIKDVRTDKIVAETSERIISSMRSVIEWDDGTAPVTRELREYNEAVTKTSKKECAIREREWAHSDALREARGFKLESYDGGASGTLCFREVPLEPAELQQ